MNSNDKKVTFIGFGLLFLMLGIAVIFGSNAGGDEDTPPEDPVDFFKDHILYSETLKHSNELNEGGTEYISIDTTGKLVKNITATLTWSDEVQQPAPRPRRHVNQPDSFALTILWNDGNDSVSGSGSNPQDEQGEIVLQTSISSEDLKAIFDSGDEGIRNWTALVKMTDAGMWVPQTGIGWIGLTDRGNLYSLDIVLEYYDYNEIKGD